jgi:histidine ammonia-lyase
MLDRTRSHGLPPFLTEDAGVNSGLMIAQYTQAAMVAENRRLAAPASVDSLPTSAMQEDHVSMGWGAARKLRRSVSNLARIIACELVCAARGVDLRAPVQPAAATAAAVAALRGAGVGGVGPDRWLSPELARAETLVASGGVLAAVERVTGPLD